MKTRIAIFAVAFVAAWLTIYPAEPHRATGGTTPAHYMLSVADRLVQPRCALCEYMIELFWFQWCLQNPFFCTK